jgi:hypothetical protein
MIPGEIIIREKMPEKKKYSSGKKYMLRKK